MTMDPREYQLIALSHVLARYRMTGELPNIEGKPFSVGDFKSHLFAGVGSAADIDIAIVENTVVNDVECTEEHSSPVSESTVSTALLEENTQQQTPVIEETPEVTTEKPTLSGKLFQFFNKDNSNESQ